HNILLDESGAVKILDMGLARFDTYLSANPDAITHATMTATGVIMGSVDYLAPEQALNSRLADHRSDIYSLGCTLHFLLTGRVLYDGETLMEKLVAHRERAVPSLMDTREEVTRGLDAVFRQMVAKNPEQRYQSMTDLVRDLEALQAGRVPAALARLGPEPNHRATRVWLGVGAIGVALGLSLWLARDVWNPPRTSDQLPSTPTAKAPVQLPPAPLVGHPQTRTNGGPGRVLLVLPYEWFYEDHYTTVTKALKSRGITFVTASSRSGVAKPKHKRIPPVPVDLTLDQFDVNDFDAVVFLGGNVDEFTRKSPKTSEQVRRLVGECLDQGRSVASVDVGVDILNDAGVTKDCDFQQESGCAVGRPKGRAGVLITAPDNRAGELAQLILSHAPAAKGPLPK
ncbi:MAG: DJ-1/PfpI family protein, partial [Planctomycetia bacterium]|nr:DJ-1/PfpI family protein [Planctomycetia bacterium]